MKYSIITILLLLYVSDIQARCIDGDCQSGTGAMIFTNGEGYYGEFDAGKYHGLGTYTWPNGTKYVGYYKNGKKDGQGTLTWSDGKSYDGDFINGKRHGHGTLTQSDGKKYAVKFLHGKEVSRELILPTKLEVLKAKIPRSANLEEFKSNVLILQEHYLEQNPEDFPPDYIDWLISLEDTDDLKNWSVYALEPTFWGELNNLSNSFLYFPFNRENREKNDSEDQDLWVQHHNILNDPNSQISRILAEVGEYLSADQIIEIGNEISDEELREVGGEPYKANKISYFWSFFLIIILLLISIVFYVFWKKRRNLPT